MSKKEQRRAMVLNEVEKRRITGRQAAEVMDLSVRHVRRLLAAYRKEGPAALAHGNRGRRPGHTCGIPLALYHDQHGIFESTQREPESIAEQLAGRRTPTQFGRLMEELGITSIPARSPQAKGRIERLWGTFQDRLVKELRLARASTLDEAHPFCQT